MQKLPSKSASRSSLAHGGGGDSGKAMAIQEFRISEPGVENNEDYGRMLTSNKLH